MFINKTQITANYERGLLALPIAISYSKHKINKQLIVAILCFVIEINY